MEVSFSQPVNLQTLTNPQLKNMVRNQGGKNFSKLKRGDLIHLLSQSTKLPIGHYFNKIESNCTVNNAIDKYIIAISNHDLSTAKKYVDYLIGRTDDNFWREIFCQQENQTEEEIVRYLFNHLQRPFSFLDLILIKNRKLFEEGLKANVYPPQEGWKIAPAIIDEFVENKQRKKLLMDLVKRNLNLTDLMDLSI